MSRVRVLTAGGNEVSVPKFKMPKAPKQQSLAVKVRKLEKQVRQDRQEWKSIDVIQTVTPALSAGILTLLNGCSQGDNLNNRDGRQIFIQSIQIKFRAEFNAAAATAQPVRFILFYDKQSNGAAPAVSELLDTATAGAVDALRLLTTRKRFKILADRRYYVAQNAGPGGIVDDIYLKKPITVQYNANNTGGITDITTNSLYYLMTSDEPANAPFAGFFSRVRFTE